MHVPFAIRESATVICALWALFYMLRYLLKDGPHDLRKAVIAFLCFAGSIVTFWIVKQEGQLIGIRYDLYIYRMDQFLHLGEGGAWMGQILLSHVWGVWALNLFYGLLPAAVMWLLIVYEPRPDYREVVYAILLNLALAPLFYAAIPVSGPAFAFPGFPVLPHTVTPHIIHLHVPPNSIPSVHFSTALLICWYLRRWSFPFAVAGAFLLLTGIATLASGQHYPFDLIVAIPYSASAVRAAKRLAHSAEVPACAGAAPDLV
ncbi:MAG TPA: phosphatase PAP2 family protein [Acidobacteriaceae bacterium]|nr:phosphatase PAP2 family protein [Acidobacteriaceae bacterium]